MPRIKQSELKCERCENKGEKRCPADVRNWRGRRTPEARKLHRQRMRLNYCDKWGPIWDGAYGESQWT